MSHHASTRLFYFLQYKSWKYSFDFTFRHKFAFHDAFIISSQRELLIFIFCWYNLFVSFWSVAMILVENHRSLEFESNDFVMNIGGILRFHMLNSMISSIRSKIQVCWILGSALSGLDPSMMISHRFIQKYFFDFLVLHCYLCQSCSEYYLNY